MGTGLTDIGEEFVQKCAWRADQITRPSSVDVGVYHDATDSISDDQDLSDLSTEPSNTNYSRQSANLDGSDITLQQDGSGNYEMVVKNVTFDFSDVSSQQLIDAFFVVVNFTSGVAGDGSDTDHMAIRGSLDQEYDTDDTPTFEVSGSGVEL